MKIIVTGGTGFIGRHLVKKLSTNTPASIVIISNTSNANGKNAEYKEWPELRPITLYSADIRNKEQISKIFRDENVDACIHLAAKISVADSLRNPEETMDINVNGTLNVLDACYNTGVNNFVFASSAAIYGDASELPVSESQELKPLSPYGRSKMLAEQHVLSYGRLKKIEDTVSLRIFNVYGVGQSSESDVISKFAKRLSNKLPPIIYGDGNHTRDFISVDDVVQSILLSIRTMEQSGDNHNGKFGLPAVFNIGTGIPTSINQLAKKMIEIFGHDLDPIYDREKADSKMILHSYADMTRSREILGFVPHQAIDVGLKEIANAVT